MTMDRNGRQERLGSDEAFAELLGKATPRPAPPEADERLIREAVHAEWQQVTDSRVRRRRNVSFALAASVVLAVFASLNLLRDPVGVPPVLQLATIEKQLGEVSVNGQPAGGANPAVLKRGDVVATGPASGLALAWDGGGSLRVDAATSLVLESEERIYLRSGRVYVDSEPGQFAALPADGTAVELSIRTEFGLVRHLGTQYMTEVGADELVVSVRAGIVSIDGRARATRGQEFTISGGGVLSTADTNGVDGWEWIEKSTPAVNLNGRSVHEALQWVSRESGRRIQYASAAAETLARSETLHGDFDIEPSRALEIFMLTVDLDARKEGEVILVSED